MMEKMKFVLEVLVTASLIVGGLSLPLVGAALILAVYN